MSIFPQIEEIKRTNKLWSNNSLFARKSITIQLTPETYEKLRQGAEGKISDADAAKKRLETKKAAAQEEFKRITDCKEDSVIDFYLETFHFNVDRAVRKFQIGTPSFHRTSLNTKHIFLLFLLICQKMSWLRVTERAVWTPRSSIQVFCYQRTILFRLDHQARVYDAKPPNRGQKDKEKDNLGASGGYEPHEIILGDDPDVHHVSQEKQEQLQEDYDKMFDL
jgi:hypothetical protein